MPLGSLRGIFCAASTQERNRQRTAPENKQPRSFRQRVLSERPTCWLADPWQVFVSTLHFDGSRRGRESHTMKNWLRTEIDGLLIRPSVFR